jgi:uncharacterized protein YjbI with pentapeptide repeats
MRYLAAVLVDGVGDLLGRPPHAREANGAAELPLTPGQRTGAGCIAAMSFLGIFCFGLMALCFGGGEGVLSKDDKDIARLATATAGCPPSCARGDFYGWSLARTEKLRGADFTGADLRASALWSANLTKSTFRGARMTGAKLMFAELRGADLTDADLRGAILTGAQLQKATLRNANLEDAQLQRADLSGADLKKAKLKGAIFDAATVWPANFNPRRAGAKMDGEP